MLVLAFSIIILGFVYYHIVSEEHNIDYGEGIEEPHNSGNIIIEVDYMRGMYESEDELENELNEITEIFEDYGLNVTFIIDDRLSYVDEIGDSDASSYKNNYHDLNTDVYMLIAGNQNSDRILGSTYNAELIVIYRDNIEDSFGDNYKVVASQYVIIHEIAHTYGCEHSDDEEDIMYPTLSISKCINYPNPEFTDPNSLAELHN